MYITSLCQKHVTMMIFLSLKQSLFLQLLLNFVKGNPTIRFPNFYVYSL